jgi:N,N'-diacetyllegionaminate synthase
MEMEKPYIIAEAGGNHNDDMDLARRLVDVAAESGVDAVKFQTFESEKLVTRQAKQTGYQAHNFSLMALCQGLECNSIMV